jgi:serine/threonine protein kinase
VNPQVNRSGDSSPLNHKRGRRNLRQLLSAEPAPVEGVMSSLLGVISALEAAHRDNRRHRNLKPEKIMFSAEGIAEVPTESAGNAGATVVSSSPKYAAPEGFELSQNAPDCRTLDVYVLGFMFYEVFLGRDLFEGQFQDVSRQGDLGWLLWHADQSKRAKPLADLIHGFPRVLSDLIDQMIAKEPTGRMTELNGITQMLASALDATRVRNERTIVQPVEQSCLHPTEYGQVRQVWCGLRVLGASLIGSRFSGEKKNVVRRVVRGFGEQFARAAARMKRRHNPRTAKSKEGMFV